ncbi:MAG: hypothetical protein ABI638_02485 [Ignavibacteriota bacterium]
MKLRDRCKLLCIASVLIFLLGVVRGIGGIIDLINNTDILNGINFSSITLVLLTITLIFLSADTIITAVGVHKQNKKFIFMGIALSVLFLIYSVLKGYLIFGDALNNAAIINVFATVTVISLLVIGKGTIDKTHRRI